MKDCLKSLEINTNQVNYIYIIQSFITIITTNLHWSQVMQNVQKKILIPFFQKKIRRYMSPFLNMSFITNTILQFPSLGLFLNFIGTKF